MILQRRALCLLLATALVSPMGPAGAQTKEPSRVIVRETPDSVFYEEAESRFYFYYDESEFDGRAGCSPAYVAQSVAEDFRGEYIRIQPQPYCGPEPVTADRLERASPVIVAGSRFTVLHAAGLAIEAEFPGRLPAAAIAMFSMRALDAEVFRDADGEIKTLALFERASERSLWLQFEPDSGFVVRAPDPRHDESDGEKVATVRWSQSEVLLEFENAPPPGSVNSTSKALATVRAPELAARLGGRPVRLPLLIRMTAGDPVPDGGPDGGDSSDRSDNGEDDGNCFGGEDGCICLDPDMMCAVAVFPFVWLLLIDAFSDN